MKRRKRTNKPTMIIFDRIFTVFSEMENRISVHILNVIVYVARIRQQAESRINIALLNNLLKHFYYFNFTIWLFYFNRSLSMELTWESWDSYIWINQKVKRKTIEKNWKEKKSLSRKTQLKSGNLPSTAQELKTKLKNENSFHSLDSQFEFILFFVLSHFKNGT